MAALLKLTSQIAYGSDYPYFPLGQIASLRQIGFGTEELQSIESGNAIRLISRLKFRCHAIHLALSARNRLERRQCRTAFFVRLRK